MSANDDVKNIDDDEMRMMALGYLIDDDDDAFDAFDDCVEIDGLLIVNVD